MNKRELVKAVAAESGFTGVAAARAANAELRGRDGQMRFSYFSVRFSASRR